MEFIDCNNEWIIKSVNVEKENWNKVEGTTFSKYRYKVTVTASSSNNNGFTVLGCLTNKFGAETNVELSMHPESAEENGDITETVYVYSNASATEIYIKSVIDGYL